MEGSNKRGAPSEEEGEMRATSSEMGSGVNESDLFAAELDPEKRREARKMR